MNIFRVRETGFMQSTPGINPTRDSVVGATHQRQAVFDGAKQCASGMYPLRRAIAKPAVIGQVQQEIRVVVRASADFVRMS